eukprot:CAMPEP_0201551898 /NCGR_PEP_ID=MMETSP0173_2-20130828/12129_1 /ASSEMBLY_ACC=CAM_ASM_000268 /TAXON_ID=218659 /ORGANISM="Vexillifera sp., Strain DIVA3 564/2" /LENGTH=243 /DNA_ID=CAMNT_0047962261 /DNA_START=295 /DNA_END=1026 /DNA_ORIENTATION=-
MDENDRDICTKQMMRGFNDCALAAGTKVTGGQTTLNEWPLIGGVAMSVCKEQDIIRPESACAGDVLVLTKPLGTQVAVNAHQWLDLTKYWEQFECDKVLTKQEVLDAYDTACESMARLNKNAATLMHEFDAHGATDVTGFGILGHAQNLAANQRDSLDFIIDTLPIIAKMDAINARANNLFKLLDGFSAETSGGLLITISAEKAPAFCEKLQQLDSAPCWIIGKVVKGKGEAKIIDHPKIISV